MVVAVEVGDRRGRRQTEGCIRDRSSGSDVGERDERLFSAGEWTASVLQASTARDERDDWVRTRTTKLPASRAQRTPSHPSQLHPSQTVPLPQLASMFHPHRFAKPVGACSFSHDLYTATWDAAVRSVRRDESVRKRMLNGHGVKKRSGRVRIEMSDVMKNVRFRLRWTLGSITALGNLRRTDQWWRTSVEESEETTHG